MFGFLSWAVLLFAVCSAGSWETKARCGWETKGRLLVGVWRRFSGDEGPVRGWETKRRLPLLPGDEMDAGMAKVENSEGFGHDPMWGCL